MGSKLAGQARQGAAAHHDAARALPGTFVSQGAQLRGQKIGHLGRVVMQRLGRGRDAHQRLAQAMHRRARDK